MTQNEAFKSWWYTEGSQTPYTHHDCEEHTMRMCEIAWNKAQSLAQPEQEPVVHDPLPRACNLAGVDYQTFLKIKAYMPVAPPQPERHELQAKGEHPAPCARHCEANAFQIVIKNLKAQLAQPEQEPVAKNEEGRITWLVDDWPQNCFLYAEPPKWTPVEIGVDVTNEGAHVVGMYVLPDAVRYVFYSEFHSAPQRTWVGLTDEDMYVVSEEESCSFIAGAKWSEEILKEKNAICSPFMISELWRLNK